MKARFVLATLVSVILAAACLPITDKADGSSCSDDGDCKSSRCHDGFCLGSKCTPGDDSSCDDGWKCTHNNPDAISGFFGASGSDTCKPTCPNCPGNTHCAKDAPAGTVCSFGKAPLDLSVSVENGIIGRSAKLTAKTANGGRITKCKWNVGDGKPDEETPGPTLERTFTEARKYRLELSCDDESGAHGFLQSSIDIACTPGGESCVAKTCCADETMRCVTGTCRVPAPPVLEITGPTTVQAYESGTYTVTVVGGDGIAQNATWKFGDSIRTEQGLTVDRNFGQAGPTEVVVNVDTDINTKASKMLLVNVCQTNGGGCSLGTGGVQCCAPLTCKGTTIPSCAP